ncbi:MAG: discoidin domain-containing protein [Tannerella sp.]|nr:discoidin domain-containing protein [Tannerella sp.]
MNKLLNFIAIIMTAGVFFSCDGMMDVHQQYLEGGEKIYAPKVDSLVFHNGKGRAQVWFWLLESPNVRSVDIFWNNNADSLIVPVSPSAGLDSMEVYVPLTEERAYTLYIRTTDIFGNHSLSEIGSATSYGAIYESTLTNRGVKSATTSGSTVEIQWYGIMDGYACSEVRYTGVNGEVQTVRALPNETSTSCPDAKAGSTYEHRSLYVPANSIDTFYLEWTPIVPLVKLDKSSWSVISWSDEEETDAKAAWIINGIYPNDNANDFWHSQWRAPAAPLPHWAIIDMGAPKEIVIIDTYRRRNNTNTKSVWYYAGDDPDPDAASWTKIAEGTFASGDLMTLTASISATRRYLKIYLPDSNSGANISVAEIDVFGYE